MGTKKLIPGLSFYIPLKILIKYKNPIIHGSLIISKRVFENVGIITSHIIMLKIMN